MSVPLGRSVGCLQEFCSSLWVLFLVRKNQEAVEPLRARVSLGVIPHLPQLSSWVTKPSAPRWPFSSLHVRAQNFICRSTEISFLQPISSCLQRQPGDHWAPHVSPSVPQVSSRSQQGYSAQHGVVFSLNTELFAGSLTLGVASRCLLVSLV